MTRARDKASAVVANFASTGIDDNADATAITINSSEQVGIGTVSPSTPLHVVGANGILVDTEGNGDGSIYFGGISGTDRTYLARSSDDFLIYNVSNGPMRFATNNTERMRILSSGGITFNGDTAAANALDDYEEGTWNAGFAGSSGVQGGFYTKIGRSVTVFVYGGINVTSTTTANITNLPFTNSGGYVAATITHDTYSNNSYNGYVGSGSTTITPIQDGTVSGAQTVIGNPKYIMVSATYVTDS